MQNSKHPKVAKVRPGSDAWKAGIRAGDTLISINGHKINDVLDYQYYLHDKSAKILFSCGEPPQADREHVCSICNSSRAGLTSAPGEPPIERVLIGKGEFWEPGLEFESFLMAQKQSCRNSCIFCFISQLPCGLRDSLYFKDDDSRLSFLQGNYITLTNLEESDVERIIEMKLSLNISVHTTNPKLRDFMLNNPRAGESLKYLYKIANSSCPPINCQIVVCRGINDGVELERTLSDLTALFPNVESIACVPAGLTKFRDSLFHLDTFTKESAEDVIKIVDSFGAQMERKHKKRLVYAADEFFLTARKDIPPENYYEDYPQYENGVGMWRSFREEFVNAIRERRATSRMSIATGLLAQPLISELVGAVNPNLRVYGITNNFFGETITVAGLITAYDIIEQLSGKDLGEQLLLPKTMLNVDGLFLDGKTILDVEEKLGIKVQLVENDGMSLVNAIV
ncbi:MAG: DUF512 domain-containing protein [Oscillospiraceae bacterium]|nr:DUF512 domain-containing protein [Oscillospiraceae bacterium]